MGKTYAHYTESSKRNVVAAVRSGLSIRGMGKRLSIPESTISQWVHSPRYSDVAPASEEDLKATPSLPCVCVRANRKGKTDPFSSGSNKRKAPGARYNAYMAVRAAANADGSKGTVIFTYTENRRNDTLYQYYRKL